MHGSLLKVSSDYGKHESTIEESRPGKGLETYQAHLLLFLSKGILVYQISINDSLCLT